MIDITIVIPTYNGAERVPLVLEKIKVQTNTDAFSWEILVVDNNSQDHTAETIRDLQKSWSKDALRYCFEPRQGLAYARQCGVDHAKGALVAFLDDDVLPAADWLAEAYRFGRDRPHIGAYGGQIHGAFEVEPPGGFERIKSFLAIRERGAAAHAYKPEVLSLPPGAALVVRKAAWQASVPKQLTLVGRINGTMLSGEDFEALLHLHQHGWEIWYCPTMQAYHQIPRHRLERDYLLSITRGCGLCVCLLRWVPARPWQRPLIAGRIVASSLKRMLAHFWRYRGQVYTDVVAACELNFMVYNLLSPLFCMQTLLKQSQNMPPVEKTI